MKKPRVLFIISIQFVVRVIIRTGFLNRIAKYVEPVLVLDWEDKELMDEIKSMDIEVHEFPKVRYSASHRHIKNKIDYVWNKKYQKSFSISLDERIDNKLYPKSLGKSVLGFIMRLYWITRYSFKKQYEKLLEDENNYFFKNEKVIKIENEFSNLNIDAVFSQTPYIIYDEVILRLAKKHNIPICAAYLSFDNTTAYGRVPVIFNSYLLWNKYNKKEIMSSYPESISKSIEIIGAPQFDFYFDNSYLWSEKVWREKLELPIDRPVILFAAGYFKIVPNEHNWLEQLDNAITDNKIIGNPIILFRIHPVDPIDRWESVLKNSKNVVFDVPWEVENPEKGKSNVKRKDIEKLVSTLNYCQVHINASSSMTIDGAIFDKPQIGPAYDDSPGEKYDKIVKDLYKRNHFNQIMKSGGLELANSIGELIYLINLAFEKPSRLKNERKEMVKKVITYDNGKASFKMEKAFKNFLSQNNLA
tara:strand:- start:1734 stop:3152 length:1419 start_codon:yes stop_codon:yes gene_type:complete